MLFDAPELGDLDLAVMKQIDELRTNLRFMLAEPRQWTGLLARVMFARSMQGSNSIEGYNVTVNDAVAAIAKDSALETSGESWKQRQRIAAVDRATLQRPGLLFQIGDG